MQEASSLEFTPGIHYSLPDIGKNLTRIEVGLYKESSLREEINKFYNINVKSLCRVNIYLLVHSAAKDKFANLHLSKPFLDPAIHQSSIDSNLIDRFDIDYSFAVHGMLKPGTSDAQGNIALEQALITAGETKQEGDQGFLAECYYLDADLSAHELEDVSSFLFNPELYERDTISVEKLHRSYNIPVPVVVLESGVKVEKIPVLEMGNEELMNLNSNRKLAASLEEMKHFQQAYKDDNYVAKRKSLGLDEKATDVEIETWFGLRSEHCFHKEFAARVFLEASDDEVFQKALGKGFLTERDGQFVLEDGIFKTFIQKPAEVVYANLEKRGCNWITSMFSDDSGVVYYDEDYMYSIKVETHNSPSNIEPIQGAKTGLNGNFRDIMGTMRGNFDILCGFFSYCTGNPHYQGWLPEGVKHPYRILKGITRGVREAGNEMQIPTMAGHIVCDPRYIAKCLVYAGAIGWSPVKSVDGQDYRVTKPEVGHRVLVAGQAVGVDGIHGATESSLSASADISLGHVQADFSFIQAKVKEFVLEAARKGLFSTTTDFGAMGLGSASHETARTTGGLKIDLAKHPKKYQGIQPWQINCSETQDRMLLVADENKIDEIYDLAKFHDVDVNDLGALTNSGYVELMYDGETVALIDINKLFDKEPRKEMYAAWTAAKEKDYQLSDSHDGLADEILKVISHPDVASKEWFFRQKDFSVKGGTILGPLYGKDLNVDTDAAIQKPLETEGRDKGAIACAVAQTSKACDIDPYYAVQRCYVDVLGKLLAVGAGLPDMSKPGWDAWAVCGNYCQPNSDSKTTLSEETGKLNMAKLLREGIAVAEMVERFNIPIISGKDSMKCSCTYMVPGSFSLEDVPELSEFIDIKEVVGGKQIEIHNPPTYLISAAAKLEDYTICQNAELKCAGDLLYLIGDTKPEIARTAYSEAMQLGTNTATLPRTNLDQFEAIASILPTLFGAGLLRSCAYLHTGGLTAALAKAMLAGKLGARIDVSSNIRELLFSETPGRFLVSVSSENKDKFEAELATVPYIHVGEVLSETELVIDGNNTKVNLDALASAYQQTFDFGGLR